MKNLMEINGHKAAIAFDPEIGMFRGEFIGLNGGADFYAKDVEGLHEEGEKSLTLYLELCKEKGIEPNKIFSGKFNLRISPQLHEDVAATAAAQNKSLNQWIAETLDQATHGG
jgi:predicted HicB family RNase H-like nuclease